MITLEEFSAWVNTHADDALIGTAGTNSNCPLVNAIFYLTHRMSEVHNNNLVVDREVIPLTAWQVALLDWEDAMYDNAPLGEGLIELTAANVKYFLRLSGG